MRTNPPQNLAETRNALSRLAAKVEDGQIPHGRAKEANNALGKVASTCKIYLEACVLSRTTPSGDWQEFLFNDPQPQ